MSMLHLVVVRPIEMLGIQQEIGKALDDASKDGWSIQSWQFVTKSNDDRPDRLVMMLVKQAPLGDEIDRSFIGQRTAGIEVKG